MSPVSDEAQALVRQHRFQGTSTRHNVASDQPKTVLKNGRIVLCEKIKSDVLRKGPLFDAVAEQHPWVEQITVNYNLRCTPHVDKNEGESLFAMFGDFVGGALAVEAPDKSVKLFSHKGVWHTFNGRHRHWTQSFEGDRWSIVTYKKPKPKNGRGAGTGDLSALPADL